MRLTRRDSAQDDVSRFLGEDSWRLDAELRDCSRLIRQASILAGATELSARPDIVGPTRSHATADESTVANRDVSETRRKNAAARAKRRAPTPLTYSALASGAVVLITGLTFLTLAVAARRPDWWNPGLPLSLLGQAALTLGIVLQIEDLRPRVRRTSV